jgi:hypothetical protein
VVGATLFWAGYVAIRAAAHPSVLNEWGFTTRQFGRSLALLSPFLLLALFGFALYGGISGRTAWHRHIILIGLLYPLWGLVQQFLVVALLAGNLKRYSCIPEPGVVLLTALVFAAVHAPSLSLVGAAFVLALVSTTVYFRTRNLWALGLFHGWFATGLYFLALGRDPWLDVVSGRLWP